MKIMVLSSHTPSLFWFRLDMMADFIRHGYIVTAVGPDPEVDWQDKFQERNIQYRQLPVERNGLNPVKDIGTFISLYKFIKEERPDKIFAYQAKTIIYGSIAARLIGIGEVYSLVAGLGSVFRGTGLKTKTVRSIMKMQYKVAGRCSKIVFFQNNDDKDEFVKHGLISETKTVIINGSGVNLDKFKPVPFPEKPSFLFIGRLIRDKGVVEYLEACKLLKQQYPDIQCSIIGPFDSNPSALKPHELQPYIDSGIVKYYGEQEDVRPFIAQSSTYVLPSYHEGTPKTILEAMAMGRPIITSDAPGCRETVVNGLNGYLVAVKDIKGIAEKMAYLAEHPDINRTMGAKSLHLAIGKYDVQHVNHAIMKTMGML